jgi:uncharacterized membrane protein YkoI
MSPRNTPTVNVAAALLALTALSAATACSDDDAGGADTTTAAATTTVTNSGADSGDGVVSREQAEQAALDFIGEGQVTFVTEEDDRGAAWEIEITRPDGSEVDVLIAPDGTVIE